MSPVPPSAPRLAASALLLAALTACRDGDATAPATARLDAADSAVVADLVGDALLRLDEGDAPGDAAVRLSLRTALDAVAAGDAADARRAIGAAAAALAGTDGDPEHAAAALHLEALRARLDTP